MACPLRFSPENEPVDERFEINDFQSPGTRWNSPEEPKWTGYAVPGGPGSDP
jgi:hypothetical protein